MKGQGVQKDVAGQEDGLKELNEGERRKYSFRRERQIL